MTYFENTIMNVKDNLGIICLARDTTKPQSVRKRSCLNNSVFLDNMIKVHLYVPTQMVTCIFDQPLMEIIMQLAK